MVLCMIPKFFGERLFSCMIIIKCLKDIKVWVIACNKFAPMYPSLYVLILNLYFIQILPSFSHNLSFYLRSNAQPQNLVHHSTTWCERSLSQGSGVNWSPQSKARHPLITWAIGYQPQQYVTSLFCATEYTASQIFHIVFSTKIVVITFQYYLI